MTDRSRQCGQAGLRVDLAEGRGAGAHHVDHRVGVGGGGGRRARAEGYARRRECGQRPPGGRGVGESCRAIANATSATGTGYET
ncbi:hypothetical protein GCM10020256_27760 [Streptomyces thermocoprophilus]